MVILMHGALHNTLCHKADILYLGYDIEHAMLALLDNVRNAVGAMDIHKLRPLVNKGLVPLRTEGFPQGGQLLG